MGFSVRVASPPHRPEVFVEIEYGGELVAEVFEKGDDLEIAFVDYADKPLMEVPLGELQAALVKAGETMRSFAKPSQ
jgi:hypothetical protein